MRRDAIEIPFKLRKLNFLLEKPIEFDLVCFAYQTKRHVLLFSHLMIEGTDAYSRWVRSLSFISRLRADILIQQGPNLLQHKSPMAVSIK